MTTTSERLDVIAHEIEQDWGDKVSPHARPYLDAMHNLPSIYSTYYLDPGTDIVAYFLANAQGWRGQKARDTKANLKRMLKEARDGR